VLGSGGYRAVLEIDVCRLRCGSLFGSIPPFRRQIWKGEVGTDEKNYYPVMGNLKKLEFARLLAFERILGRSDSDGPFSARFHWRSTLAQSWRK
jgi:hypothetical protein